MDPTSAAGLQTAEQYKILENSRKSLDMKINKCLSWFSGTKVVRRLLFSIGMGKGFDEALLLVFFR